MSIFKCNHVSYSYDKNTNVLKNITFSFELGKVYAILGSSGSGKTTLLSLLGGLDIPTTGTILYENEDIKKLYDEFLGDIGGHNAHKYLHTHYFDKSKIFSKKLKDFSEECLNI